MSYAKGAYVKKEGKLHSIIELEIKLNNNLETVHYIYEKQNGVWVEVYEGPVLPESGSIVMFDGLEKDIPEGWAFCDGTNGTPDLRNRFVMAGDSCGQTGGGSHTHSLSSSGSHTHTLVSSSHTHNISNNSSYTNEYLAADHGNTIEYDGYHSHNSNSSTHNHGGTSSSIIEPAYYKLAFIMKL